MPTNKQRVSINLLDSEYAELAAMAEKHSLSMAWIGHRAIVEFMEQNRCEDLQLPLGFEKRLQQRGWHEKKLNGPPSARQEEAVIRVAGRESAG